MNIISKIEIKHFRSFDGGKDQEKVRIDDLKDLNVFSGSNDSGKSNVLRALNLFFNNEISPGIKFDKNRDFSKIVATRFDKDVEDRKTEEQKRVDDLKKVGIIEKPKDLRRSDEVITIKLFFNNTKRQRGLPESFWISRTYSQKNSFQGEYVYQNDLKSAQATLFIQNFKFEYVPAIKDRTYFLHLFEKLQNYLFEKGDKSKKNKFTDASEKFTEILTTETVDLFENFLHNSGVEASFHIPSTLVDFFRTLSVKTENDVSLFDRGDGVQAKFIPEILDEISKESTKNIIWGFEEPENSYEAKNIRKLKDEFQNNYSKKYQIFLTTHTKEFLAITRNYTSHEKLILADKKINTQPKKQKALESLSFTNKSSDVSIYRVWKNERTNQTSLITRFDETNNAWEELCDDLGIIQEARIIESLQYKINEQLTTINNSKLNQIQQQHLIDDILKEHEECIGKLRNTNLKIEEYLKPILVVEDTYDDIYKIAYLKCNDIGFDKNNINDIFNNNAPFIIRRAESAGAVAGMLLMNNTGGYEDKKIIGLFDFDKEGTEKFYHLKKHPKWEDTIKGNSISGFYKKRKDHETFYAMLLPIPKRLEHLIGDVTKGKFTSYIEIENLVDEKTLIDNKLVDKDEILTGLYHYKIKDKVKPNALNNFINIPKDKFSDFLPLFNKINELFNI